MPQVIYELRSPDLRTLHFTTLDFDVAEQRFLNTDNVIRHNTDGTWKFITNIDLLDSYRADLRIDKFWANQSTMPKSGPPLVDTNLKTAAAASKPRISDVPPVALFALGAAMSDGKEKYGRYNWRETGSTSSVFYDAMQRHLNAWYSGEDYASDSKVHHLAHLMASCAILLDSQLHGSLNDDRYEGINPLIKKIWKNDSTSI
jgi:hypothetical protein